jgi:hypothetical protein
LISSPASASAARRARSFRLRLEADEAGDAVILVHDRSAGAELGE